MATKHPLKGWAVVVTRPEHQAQFICEKIQQLGGQAIAVPAIEIRPPSSPVQFDQCLRTQSQYDLSVFISQNAVNFVFKRMALLGLRWEGSLAAVGPVTADSLLTINQTVIIPEDGDYRSEGMLRELAKLDLSGAKIAIYRAQNGREWLQQQLARLGAQVDYVEAYQRLPINRAVKGDVLQLAQNRRLISLCNSVDAAQCFLKRLDASAYETIVNSLMVVPSTRVKQHTKNLVKNIIVAQSALDADMLAAIPVRLS